eukprot:TRINITY_DN40_c0_g2_i1.p1 TRINITY_DN40_c0_g2~~TRINITY_DN40_c0_g2_i1.p1  ORF type:complete len:203 (+),score=42.81 TRINITY_DN40_c0_g2_i1:112-720(+)
MSRRKVLLKLIVLGESGVGKTSLLLRYVDNKFTLATKSTIGADFLTKEIEVDDQAVNLQIWDTAGQERFQGLGTTFYRGSDGAIFVFDVTRKETFDELEAWREAFLIQINQEGNDDYPMLVIGNKIDCPDRAVTTEQGEAFCRKYGLQYLECSAKNDVNVDTAFTDITRNVINKQDPNSLTYDDVKIDLTGDKKETNGGCCN